MKLFGHHEINMLAPLSGKIIPVAETPDPVFAGKVLGDGTAVIPSGKEVVSPVDGTISHIARTLHAICLTSEDGLEILIHLGIDTVELKGEGFTCCVKEGQHVKAGQKLMDMDLNFIKSKGYSSVSPCIITNMDHVKKMQPVYGQAEAGKTVMLTYET